MPLARLGRLKLRDLPSDLVVMGLLLTPWPPGAIHGGAVPPLACAYPAAPILLADAIGRFLAGPADALIRRQGGPGTAGADPDGRAVSAS